MYNALYRALYRGSIYRALIYRSLYRGPIYIYIYISIYGVLYNKRHVRPSRLILLTRVPLTNQSYPRHNHTRIRFVGGTLDELHWATRNIDVSQTGTTHTHTHTHTPNLRIPNRSSYRPTAQGGEVSRGGHDPQRGVWEAAPYLGFYSANQDATT